MIGGWVIKYLIEYFAGHSKTLAGDAYFTTFISNGWSTEICFIIFTLFTLGIIYAGVRNGIERVSRFMMPILIVLSLIIAVYSVTRPGAIAVSYTHLYITSNYILLTFSFILFDFF